MGIRLDEIAKSVDADLIAPSGDILIEGAASLSAATETEIGFLSSQKYLEEAVKSRAAAIIVPKDIAQISAAKLVTANPYLAWARVLEFFKPDRSLQLPLGRHETAVVDPSADIADDVHIGASVYIGANTKVGKGCIIHAGVVIEEDCCLLENVEIHPNTVIHYGTSLGNNCVIWANVVIGGYGFGNARDGARYVAIPQLGNAILEDDVSVGACSTIDRGAIEDTIIRRGAKIDNLVMIAHNVEIGEDTAIASQTGISGSTKVGDRVMIAGQAGFVGHITIGDEVFVGAKAGVSKSVPSGAKITGYPARNLMDVRRSDTSVKNLPELSKRVRELESQLQKLLQKI